MFILLSSTMAHLFRAIMPVFANHTKCKLLLTSTGTGTNADAKPYYITMPVCLSLLVPPPMPLASNRTAIQTRILDTSIRSCSPTSSRATTVSHPPRRRCTSPWPQTSTGSRSKRPRSPVSLSTRPTTSQIYGSLAPANMYVNWTDFWRV